MNDQIIRMKVEFLSGLVGAFVSTTVM